MRLLPMPSAPGSHFCSAARCNEMRTVAEYLTGKYTEKIRGEINTLSGVFPTDDKALNRFCKLYTSCAQGADLLALWDVGAERQVIDGCHGTRFTQLRALEPYYYANPWSAALAGKHVLVVHPFADTIRAQYQKRGELFTNAPGGGKHSAGTGLPDRHPGSAGPCRAENRV